MKSITIDESNWQEHYHQAQLRLSPQDRGQNPGCIRSPFPYGTNPRVWPAESFLQIIPRHLWHGLIENQRGNFLGDHTRQVLAPHDQGTTKYCWAHGTTRAVEALRIFEAKDPKILSAESIAVPLTGGRNRGGYAEEAIEQFVTHGACEQHFWPANDRNINHAQAGWDTNAKLYRVIRWIQVQGWEMQLTCALLRIPVAIGLSWWGHLVCQLDPVILEDGTIGIGADNSWGRDYGDNGYFYLTERRGTADLGAIAPISSYFCLAQ